MTTSEITEALQKAARLRGEVERLDPKPPKRRRLSGRVLSFVTRSLACLVVVLLAVDALFAYHVFHRDTHESGTTASSTDGGPTYSNLAVISDSGLFAGQVSITNPFARDIEVLVNIDLYDGERAVGELFGKVTLKPDSTSVVELRGSGESVHFTESRVHLSGWPVSVSQEETTT